MSKSGFSIEGLEDLRGKLEQLPERHMRKMEDVVDYIVRELANYAKDTGTYRDVTGNLRGSIYGAVVSVTNDFILGEVRAPMQYAASVEARGRKVVSHIVVERWDWIMKTLNDKLAEFIAEENR